jgi:hypothetical protein
VVDGQQIPGTWRPIFIHDMNYYLTELYISADGVINCWENVTLDGLREKIRSGWVATALPQGAFASVHDLASWKFDRPPCCRNHGEPVPPSLRQKRAAKGSWDP